jgi:hypothetical protein
VTLHSLADRLTPAALRPVVLEDVPEGWERRAFDPSSDADALAWLGFEPGEPDEPLLPWSRPATWPTRGTSGRHRASARVRTA